jgi:glycosyltransferase involved in cell wall biosynthesis
MIALPVDRLTSVIVPCWNQVEFTRKCLHALFRQTAPSWELIVIDNGSTDGTGSYLAGVQDASPAPVTVIGNGTNRGFPAAINQGLQYARGEYLVLLNNDVVVTEGWLSQLIGLATVAPTTEMSREADQGVSTTEHAETTENWGEGQTGCGGERETEGRVLTAKNAKSAKFRKGNRAGFREVLNAYPGRNVSVIDLAPDGRPGEGIAGRGIGLVGPMSNYAAPPQLVENVPYRDLGEMMEFARRWHDEHRGQWFTVPKLSGFCLLMKRAVYDAIGGLDERFGLGFFDDDDLAERARRAGFELAVAHDLFVHHFGSRSFVGNGIDSERLLNENAARFAAKWGDSVPRGRRVALRSWSNTNGAASDGPTVQMAEPGCRPTSSDANVVVSIPAPIPREERASVSLTMIVRDEESNLPRCLESVRGLFDEIVIVDTGSRDRTVEIARSFGARVFDFVWVDDFAAARNAALARAKSDYAFWLDADDLLEPPERAKLEGLLTRLSTQKGTGTGVRDRSQSPFASAFVVRCRCDPGPDGSGGDTVVDHIRLFPIIEGVRWTYRVHEQILPALKRAGVPLQWTDITVRHTGYSDRALRLRKLERDGRILREELAERPDDPFTLFNLGSIAIERADWDEALELLKQSLSRSAPTDSITRKLFALIARAHQMKGDHASALRCCAEGLTFDPDDAELWFRKAVVHRHNSEPADAEQCWRKILTLSRPQKFASVDQGIYGHLTRRNLAALAMERGDAAEARRQWQAVLAECPADREANIQLAKK